MTPTPNTTNSELRDLLQYICSDYLQSTHPKDPDGMRLVIETGIEDIEALITSKVEEALENHKKVMKLADTYTFEDGTQFVKVKALQSKEGEM